MITEHYPLLSDWTQAVFTHIRSLPLIGFLLALTFFDIVTGISAAWYSGQVNSTTSFRGMIKKANIFFYVSFGAVVQQHLCPDIPMASLIAGGFAISEIISILENAAVMGIKLPEEVTSRLLKYNESKAARAKDIVKAAPLVETHVHTTGPVSIKETKKS